MWRVFATPLIVVSSCIAGCAGERAAMVIANQTAAVAQAVIEKAQVTRSELNASGKVRDPHYRVNAFWTTKTGLEMDIGLDGVEMEALAKGSGEGEDRPLSPGARAALRAKLADPFWGDELPLEVVAWLRKKAEETPSVPLPNAQPADPGQ